VTIRKRAGAGLLMLFIAAAPSAAFAQEADHHGTSASAELSQLDPQTAAVARRLWGDLVCLCDRCRRLALSACHCPDAARERKEMVELLRGRDLSSPAAADSAYQAVVAAVVARKGKQVLASERSSPTRGDWHALVVSMAILAMACVAVAVIEHRRRHVSRAARRRR